MTVAPAPAARLVAPRWRRMITPSVTIGGLTLASLALHLRDPHGQGSWGECPLLAATGIYCPGCGGLRAVNDLGNGHLLAALSSNLVFTLMVPVIVLGLVAWAHERWTGSQRQWRWDRQQRYVVVFLVFLTVFSVVRNLPFGAVLAP